MTGEEMRSKISDAICPSCGGTLGSGVLLADGVAWPGRGASALAYDSMQRDCVPCGIRWTATRPWRDLVGRRGPGQADGVALVAS